MIKSMLARVREARAAELEDEGGLEGGFTLIELMVVLLIIAILLAIAIPTFLGVTGSAKDRSAQSTLTNVLTETVALYQNNQAYPAVAAGDVSAYSASDPQFSWADGSASASKCTTANTKCVSVFPVDVAGPVDLHGVILAVMSSTGTCWWTVNLQTNPNATTLGTDASGTPFVAASGAANAGTYYAHQANSTTCYATASLAGSGFNWGTSYSDSAGVN